MSNSPIDAETILQAYAIGVFPMAEHADDPEIQWIKPYQRGLIPLDDRFHIPRSLRKVIKRNQWTMQLNQQFPAVMEACAGDKSLTCKRDSTWINGDIKRLYTELHHMGYAHSLEIYDHQNTLIGGLYGIAMGGAFFGESMFSKTQNASKIALVHLVTHLRLQNFTLLDCQFLTDHLHQFGAYTVPAEKYDLMLKDALQQQRYFA